MQHVGNIYKYIFLFRRDFKILQNSHYRQLHTTMLLACIYKIAFRFLKPIVPLCSKALYHFQKIKYNKTLDKNNLGTWMNSTSFDVGLFT